MPQKVTIPRTCEQCGAPFLAYASKVKKGRGRFCSCRCSRRSRGPVDKRKPIDDRFWAKVQKTDTCWLWTGGKDTRGYGRLGKDTTKVLAHRFSWELHNGPIPEGMFVCHNCPGGDNPSCVNPQHLWLGSPLDNTRDAVEKGQMPHGEQSGNARLTDAQVLEIRARHANGERINALSRSIGVSIMTISLVVRRKIWKHI